MVSFFVSVFVILHGLVHLWYVTLNQEWVEFQPEMGWTGDSWILPKTSGSRTLATVMFAAAALGFVMAGAGGFSEAPWWRAALGISAVLSSVSTILFWDGNTRMLVQKGAVSLLINVAILALLAATA